MHQTLIHQEKFWLITGTDYRRSMDWAATWTNPVTAAIRQHRDAIANPQTILPRITRMNPDVPITPSLSLSVKSVVKMN